MDASRRNTQDRIWNFFLETQPRGVRIRNAFKSAPPAERAGLEREVVADEFSLFFDQHAKLASELGSDLLQEGRARAISVAADLAGTSPENQLTSGVLAAIDFALQECEQLRQRNPELAEAVLMLFLTHYREAQSFSIPPLALRAPYKVIPSFLASSPLAGPQGAHAGSTEPENLLDWFREDPLFNEHHEHWHIVYPFAGIFGKTRDRQGEMFLYMHQQMLARYDTERMAVMLPRVRAFDDLTRRMSSGYHPNAFVGAAFPYHAARPAGLHLRDLDRPMYGMGRFTRTLPQLIQSYDRLQEAVGSGFLRTKSGGQIKIEANNLGHTLEASQIDSVDLEYYDSFHNNGHRFISACHDPDGSHHQPLGVMARPETSFRDPIFFEWHKTIDNLAATWQENQVPHDFSDAPDVLIRQGRDALGAHWSPDIILCDRESLEKLRSEGLSMQAIADGAFGGTNWRNDYSQGTATWKDAATGETYSLETISEVRTFMKNAEIVFDGEHYPYEYLNHQAITYFFRIENRHPEVRNVTVRLFLVPQGYEDDRRMYIEMDKFRCQLGARDNRRTVVWRHDEQSALVRKPAIKDPGDYNKNYDPSFGGWVLAPLAAYIGNWESMPHSEARAGMFGYHSEATAYRVMRFGEEDDFDAIELELKVLRLRLESELNTATLQAFATSLAQYFEALTKLNLERAYCGCGYPYSLLFPRGTRAGMRFTLRMMVTDWERDRVSEESCCASMSFCGAKDRYPDMRAMGYPFDRPFDSKIESVLDSLSHVAARAITIRWHK